MSKKNILIIVSGSVIGGHESQAYEIAADLIGIGHKINIICSAQSTFDYFKVLGCNIELIDFIIPGKVWRQWLYSSKVRQVLKQRIIGFDTILISAGTIEGLIAVSHAIKKDVKDCRVIAYVPMYIDRSLTHGIVGKIYNYLLNCLGRAVDGYLTINKIQSTIMEKNLRIPTAFISNRIRTVIVPETSFGKRLVYVGRFDDKQKGLLDLLTLLNDTRNPYRELIMIGDGPDRDRIVAKAKTMKLVNVSFPGWLSGEALENFLGSDDVLILNSRWEGEPLVVREFGARGLLSISREISGVRGLIKKRFRFKNSQQLCDLLNQIYSGNVASEENGLMRIRESDRAACLTKVI